MSLEYSLELLLPADSTACRLLVDGLVDRPGNDELPECWWARLQALGGPHWQRLLSALNQDRSNLLLEGLQLSAAASVLYLSTSRDGDEVARALLGLSQDSGCSSLEILVYNEASEVIWDDEGNRHRLGLRFFINAAGELAEADYPEIEYEYI